MVEVTDENFEAEVLQSELPVVIDFWAPWCGPCKIMGRTFESLSEDPEYTGKVKFVKINTDVAHWVSGQFMIRSIPTIVLMTKATVVAAEVGIRTNVYMKKWLTEKLATI